MTTRILPDVSTATEPARHTPERVLSTIAATTRLDGLTAPRRISFDESTPTTPLAVLSLTWLSLADMRPWLVFFGASETHTYRRDDGTAHYSAYADYHGWSLSLNALDSVRCTCGAERVHQLGCPAVAQCPAIWYGGWCPGEVRHDDGRCDTHTSHNLTYDAPVTVSPEGVPEHLADHFAVLNPYVPVPMPTGVAANGAEAARLNGSVHHVPANVHPRGHEPTWQSGHPQRDPVRIVDVTTIPELPTGNDAAISRTGRQPYASDQHLFAEAPDRLRTARDDAAFAGIVEASS